MLTAVNAVFYLQLCHLERRMGGRLIWQGGVHSRRRKHLALTGQRHYTRSLPGAGQNCMPALYAHLGESVYNDPLLTPS
eukprot:9503108-Pyramimonas_sp.AAC.1